MLNLVFNLLSEATEQPFDCSFSYLIVETHFKLNPSTLRAADQP